MSTFPSTFPTSQNTKKIILTSGGNKPTLMPSFLSSDIQDQIGGLSTAKAKLEEAEAKLAEEAEEGENDK
jgi:hypothetical protein